MLEVVFDGCREICGFSHSKVQHSGSIFPLPETLLGLKNVGVEIDPQWSSCLLVICRALNSYYGATWEDSCPTTLAKRRSIEQLLSYVSECNRWEEKCSSESWSDLLSVRSIDYKGDEVRVARRFRWENLVGALPEEVGRIPLDQVCELGTLEYINNFEQYLLPIEAQVYTKPPAVMVEEDSWEQVCSGLVAQGICDILPIKELHHIRGRPMLNGMFGVSKEEHKHGWEVYRLIMNLVPVNKICRNLGGDIATLPSWAGMTAYMLEGGEVSLMSSEDVRCFFYLFSIPAAWKRYMGFNKVVPASLVPAEFSGEPCVLVSRVLPMGFLNSVSIAQHIHRRVARLALRNNLGGLGAQDEIRRDRPLPSSTSVYRIYLDNFDVLEKVDAGLAGVLQGTPSIHTLRLREQYSILGLPRHPKKEVVRQPVSEIQGAIVNGVTGKVTPKPSKVLKYLSLGLQLLSAGEATQKQLQIVCGGFVYCTMFRRALLGLLNGVWKFIMSFEGEPPVVRKVLPPVVRFELIRFLCAMPLAQMNLKAPMLGQVTASDASETGGGFCISRGLSPMGVHASHCSIRGDLTDLDDHIQVLTVGLFDGIGALRVAADVLLLPMAGHISSEVSKEGARVLEANFPDTVHVGDVRLIDEEDVINWACRYSNVGVVVVGGGPPCQGVSGLNSDRKGALKDARSSLVPHVRRVHGLCKKHFRWAQVHFLMESVASMDDDDGYIMSEDIGMCPWRIDSYGISLCHRPRLYWLSWEVQGGEGVSVVEPDESTWYGFGTIQLQQAFNAADFLQEGSELMSADGLPTFTTARPRSSPGNRPAGLWQCTESEIQAWQSDDHRYPPYQYRAKNLVRGHQGLRLPTISEKEVIMGFPLHYTSACFPKSAQGKKEYSDCRHSLIGNSWNVQVVSWLLSCLFGPLGLTKVTSLDQIVSLVTPGRSMNLRGFLQRPPMHNLRGPDDHEQEAILARKLSSFVSIKGEDLLLQSQTEGNLKYQRLRQSVPARLWRWKVVAGWKWRYTQAHINELELRAALTTLSYRLERRREHGARFIHLVDSLVVLHCLSRGRSRKLRRPLSQINALLLASDAHPIWAYVATKQNPADRPSRMKVRRHAVKKSKA